MRQQNDTILILFAIVSIDFLYRYVFFVRQCIKFTWRFLGEILFYTNTIITVVMYQNPKGFLQQWDQKGNKCKKILIVSIFIVIITYLALFH